MKLPDGSDLMHGSQPYDPVKAHEYYLRTRKLKGRKKGTSRPPAPARTRGSTYTVDVGNGQSIKLTSRQLAAQQAYAAERVASIKKKLHQLNAELKKKMAEARKREREAKKPDSAAEKAEAAREAKKYRDKNKQKLKTKSKREASEEKPKTKEPSVDDLKKTIANVQKNLKKALARQRSLAKATKN